MPARQRPLLVAIERCQSWQELAKSLSDLVLAAADQSSWRARRTRSRSRWVAAIRRASRKRPGLASSPAIACASASISPEYPPSKSTGIGDLRPWRNALRDERALPALVFGPVL